MLNARVRAGVRRAVRAAAGGPPRDADGRRRRAAAVRPLDPPAGDAAGRAAGHRHAGLGGRRRGLGLAQRRRPAVARAPRRGSSPTGCARRSTPAGAPGDIVVLVRATASLRLLEEALEEQGLPTYVVGGRGYWSQEQVRDGLAWLRVLANPHDEEALLTVLASPFCGARHRRAVLLAEAGRGSACGSLLAPAVQATAGRARATRAELACSPTERDARRAHAARGAARARDRRHRLRPRRARPPGRRPAAREPAQADAARAASTSAPRAATCAASSPTPPARDLAEAREGEAALESDGLDAVRLMTIHRAKGLEFPVVCVADLGRQGPARAAPRCSSATDGAVGPAARAARRRRRRSPRSPGSGSPTPRPTPRPRRSGGCSTSR